MLRITKIYLLGLLVVLLGCDVKARVAPLNEVDSSKVTTSDLTITLVSTQSSTTNSSISVTAVFSKPVSQFTKNQITVLNGTADSVTQVNSKLYSFLVQPQANGLVVISVAEAVVTDLSGRGFSASNALNFTFDQTLPKLRDLSFASGETSTSPTPTVNFRLDKAASVSLFLGTCSEDFKISQTEEKLGDGGIESISVTEGFLVDGSYPVMVQANIGEKQGTCMKVGDYLLDTERPTILLSSEAASLLNGPFLVTATFSESVSGLSSEDIYVAGGMVLVAPSVVPGTNYTQYRFTVQPLSQGLITVRVAENSATDAAGNLNLVSDNLTRNHDSVRPSVSLSSPATEFVNGPFSVKATFSESVTGLTLSDLSVTGGTASNVQEVSGSDSKEFSFTISPNIEGDVSVKVLADGVLDSALNGNSESAVLTRVHDTLSPSVSVTSTSSTYVNQPFEAKAVFSEPVSGLSVSGIQLSRATAAGVTGVPSTYVTGYGYQEYTFTVTPTEEGQVSISISADAAVDRVGNPNTASSNILNRTYDITRPALVSLTSGSSSLINETFVVSLEFNEPMSSVESSDLNLVQASAGSPTEVLGSNGTRWELTITPTAQGEVSVSIITNGAKDLAGNGVLASGQIVSRTFDNIKPSISLTSMANTQVNAAFTVTADFSETINGFSLSDVSITGGSVSNLQTLETDKKFQFTVTPSSEGTVSLSVNAGGVSDPTGNSNEASNILSRTYDITRPSVTLQSSSTPNVNGPFTVVAQFSEIMASFPVSALTVSGATVSNPVAQEGSNNQNWEFTVTPQHSGTVSVQVLENSAADLAGNQNMASASLTRIYDIAAPVLSAVTRTSPASPTTEQTISFSFTVNEISTVGLFSEASCTISLSGSLIDANGNQNISTNTLLDGTYDVYIRAQDKAGNVTCDSALSAHVIDTTAPEITSVAISNSSPTKSNTLSVLYTAADATSVQMQVALSASSSLSCGGSWVSFEPSQTITIPEYLKNGTVYVNVRYRDTVLNQSSCLQAQIDHDNTPPADPTAITINDGAPVTDSSTVTVKVTSNDSPYEVALSQNSAFCTDDDFLVNWVSFGFSPTRSLSHTLTTLNATNTVYARVRDQAGNISGCVSSSIIHSNTAPINPGISIEGGAARTNKTNVTLTLSMTPSGSNSIEMYVTNTANCSVGGTWVDYSSSISHTLNPLNQTTSVYVKYRDKLAPYFETECVSDSIYHDDIAPLGTGISLNSGESATPHPSIRIHFSASNTEDPYSEYQLNLFESNDCTGSSLSGGWTDFNPWIDYYVPESKQNTQLYFSVKFRDLTGNETTCASATILHDDRQPSITFIDKSSGPLAGGSNITISGVNFRSGSENSVYFDTRKATCSLVGSPVNGVYSQLSCVVPAPSPALSSAQSVTVRVTNPSTLYAESTYTYQEAPQIVNASPGTGLTRTGDLITLTGAFFREGITITVGGIEASQVNRTSSTQVKFVTPAFSSVGSQNIVITNTDSQTATLSFQFLQRCTKSCGGTGNSCYDHVPATQDLCATLEDGNQSSSDPTYVDLVTRIPTVYIESNKKETTNQQVTLSLSPSYLNATEMYLTANSGCDSGGTWEPYAVTKVWTLSGSGTQTVYAKFRNSLGETTSCVSDSITVNASSTNMDYLTKQFQVWKETDGTRILSASGLWGSSWQKKLNSNGKGYHSDDFLATQSNLEQLDNRANPTNTYLDDSNKFLTNRWVYYSRRATFVSLKTGNSTLTEGVDWIDRWDSLNSTNGLDGAWYEGNITTCSQLGMRLPTAYETRMPRPSDSKIPLTDGNPTFAGDNGIPSGTSVTWTATADTSAVEYNSYWCFYKDADNGNAETQLSIPSGAFYDVRCVLP
jgi:hypothetical protein